MGTNKLLDRLKVMLETNAETDQRKRHDALKKLLKKLKAKQKTLQAKYDDAEGGAQAKLAKKLKLVKAHRQKALKILRDKK